MTLITVLCILTVGTGIILCLVIRNARALRNEKHDSNDRINREKIAAISTFSSVVSHELKNPLASLKNIAYFFSKMPALEDPRAQRMMDILGTEIEKMNELILNLLDLSRIKRLVKLPCDIGLLALEAFEKASLPDTIAVTKNIEHITLPFDAVRFTQIITTLITNARDAMPNGGSIDFTLQRAGASAEIVCRDTGTGMDYETAQRVFDPLFTTKTKVLGMGLTIAREIIHLHNGHIELSSKKNTGTTVTISLPIP